VCEAHESMVLIDCGFYKGNISRKYLERHPKLVCYAFEPNDLLLEDSQPVREKYADRLHFSDRIVWVNDDQPRQLWLASNSDMQGSSVYKTKKRVSRKSVTKQTVDLSRFIRDTVSDDDYLILKMDIEGAEYEVLLKMIKDGTLKMVDELIVEFHAGKIRNRDRVKRMHERVVNFLHQEATWLKVKVLKG